MSDFFALSRKRKIEKSILIILISVFGLYGCGTQVADESNPNMKLVHELGMDSTNLVYQYYQKYGFTDACEDIRMVFKMQDSPGLNRTLPLDAEDLKAINQFYNKVDSISGLAIKFSKNTRQSFSDIELKFIEYSYDSLLTVQLDRGEYEITQTEFSSTLRVFDSNSRLFYIEVHRCDGN